MSKLVEVKTPELSESVQSGSLLEWRKAVGDRVARDEVLADLETDKVILEVAAPAEGVLVEIRVPAGGEVAAGDVLAVIDTEAAASATQAAGDATASPPTPSHPASARSKHDAVPPGGEAEVFAAPGAQANLSPTPSSANPGPTGQEFLPPRLRRKETAAPAPAPQSAPMSAQAAEPASPAPAAPGCPLCPPCPPTRQERRVPMTRLRQRIAERLKEAQDTAAMLTTFNEVNMQPVMDLRQRYQERFQKEHGVKLGFMSFFTKAVCQALKDYPLVNASLDGRDIVYHDYYDIGVAVSSERGLVVPVLRDADRMSFADIERRIADFARRANRLELTLEELEGGTFTISNGGVFGSLLSTPILNPPQSGVLGLHKIQERPVAENGQVVIRPMMYVALTYDHRLIDGREAVSFLREVKEALEDPARLLLEL
jgi:2-oxoglutarate dehydrogenase E2 component (dihydrolipoamide succinyltransferase)